MVRAPEVQRLRRKVSVVGARRSDHGGHGIWDIGFSLRRRGLLFEMRTKFACLKAVSNEY